MILIFNMAKPFPKRRYNHPGHAHELTCSCFRRTCYFEDEDACHIFVEELERVRQSYHLWVWAYVVMPDHVHVLLWPRESVYDIALIQKSLNGATAKRYASFLKNENLDKYNACLERKGDREIFRFWQRGGGFDRNMWNALVIHNSIRYIENNPVRQGLVKKASDWPHSSAHARAGKGGLMPDICQIPHLMRRADK